MERYVYVDKTLLARDVMRGSGITLFCRPRRFGKSTAMRMLQWFFEKGGVGTIPDRRHLFDNLAGAQAGESVNRERGTHPVIYLSLGGCALGSYDKTASRMAQQIASEHQRHAYLYDSSVVLPFLRSRFARLAAQEPTDADLSSSLSWLSALLADYHGAKTVIIIDEYDTPINDGHRFGNAETYNPWSVLHYLRTGEAQPYWTNTSMNGIVRDLVARADDKLSVELATVAAGGTVEKPLDLQTVFDDLEDNPDAVWPQMYQAGYLTTDDTGSSNDSKRLRGLRVPNFEVRGLFEVELMGRARRMAGSEFRLRTLHATVARDDLRHLEEALRQIMLEGPSFLDLADEGRCHMLLPALLYGVPGYRPPISNRKSGDGRSDVLLEPLPAHAGELPAIAIEVKRPHDTKGKPLEGDALLAHARDVALAQAVRMDYGHGLSGRGLLLWVASFGGKHVACACK